MAVDSSTALALVGGLFGAVIIGLALVESAHMAEKLVADLMPALIGMMAGLIFLGSLIVMLNNI